MAQTKIKNILAHLDQIQKNIVELTHDDLIPTRIRIDGEKTLGRLTDYEILVVTEMANGQTYKEIADHLQRSKRAIDASRRNIFLKLGARNSTHAIAIAFKVGILK